MAEISLLKRRCCQSITRSLPQSQQSVEVMTVRVNVRASDLISYRFVMWFSYCQLPTTTTPIVSFHLSFDSIHQQSISSCNDDLFLFSVVVFVAIAKLPL